MGTWINVGTDGAINLDRIIFVNAWFELNPYDTEPHLEVMVIERFATAGDPGADYQFTGQQAEQFLVSFQQATGRMIEPESYDAQDEPGPEADDYVDDSPF